MPEHSSTPPSFKKYCSSFTDHFRCWCRRLATCAFSMLPSGFHCLGCTNSNGKTCEIK